MTKEVSPEDYSQHEHESKGITACNEHLKLGDICDVCARGVMLPPGGPSYYENLLKQPNPPRPIGHEKIVCPRCGHWHISEGADLSVGSGKASP